MVLKWPQADGTAGYFLKTDGAAQTSWVAGTAAAAVLTTHGDILFQDSGPANARLAAGTAGQVLTTQGAGADPVWAAVVGKNKIINGDMRIAQRGTTAAMTTTQSYLSIDRWTAYMNGTAAGVFNQVAGEGEFQYMAKCGRNTSTAETGTLEMRYNVESHNIIPLAGGVVTFSYYAKAGANYSAAASDIHIRVYTGTTADQGGSGAGWAGTATPLNTTQVITTTLTRYEHQITVAAGVKEIQFNFFWVPVGTAGADDNLYITGVQLEAGSIASDFEHEDIGTTLAKCQRYYEFLSTAYGTMFASDVTSGGTYYLSVHFKQTKRSSPTIVYTYHENGGGFPATVVSSLGTPSISGFTAQKVATGTGTGGYYSFYWTASSEL
jgi:hypothetical protein